MRHPAAVLPILITLSACTSATKDTSDTDTQVADTDPTGACNTLVLPAAVTKTPSADAAPAYEGGAVVDGTYVLTSIVAYAGAATGSVTNQEFWKISGTSIQIASDSSEMDPVYVSGTVSYSGTTLTAQFDCPGAFTLVDGYSVTADGLMTSHGDQPDERAYFTRQ